MKYSGHRKLLWELSKLSNLMLLTSSDTKEHWCIYSCLQISPKENWFQYVRRVYTTAIHFPCITPWTNHEKKGQIKNFNLLASLIKALYVCRDDGPAILLKLFKTRFFWKYYILTIVLVFLPNLVIIFQN